MEKNEMSSNPNKKNNKKLVIIGIVVVVLIILLAVVANLLLRGEGKQSSNIPKGAIPYNQGDANEDTNLDLSEEDVIELSEEERAEVLGGAVVVVPGANPISKEGEVLTHDGKVAKNDAGANHPDGPSQTKVDDPDKLPDSVIKLSASGAGFEPSSFSVKANEIVTVAFSSSDEFLHVLKFEDTNLSSVAISASADGTTNVMTFKAPSTPGEYNFICDVIGHSRRGEVGKMIVE